jgi:hypothetical protein
VCGHEVPISKVWFCSERTLIILSSSRGFWFKQSEESFWYAKNRGRKYLPVFGLPMSLIAFLGIMISLLQSTQDVASLLQISDEMREDQLLSRSQSQSNLWPWCYFFWVFWWNVWSWDSGSLAKTRFSSIRFVELIEQEVCN